MGIIEMVDPRTITLDGELKGALPDLDDETYQGLKNSIKERGILVPLLLKAGILVDGHNRRKAAIELGFELVPVTSSKYTSKEDNLGTLADLQNWRRNMSKEQRNTIILRIYDRVKGVVGDRRSAPPVADAPPGWTKPGIRTTEVVAQQVKEETGIDVSSRTVERVVEESKPKKEYKEKSITDVWIIFLRKTQRTWEIFPGTFMSSRQAQDFVQENKANIDPFWNRELYYWKVPVTFFTANDQKTLHGVEE